MRNLRSKLLLIFFLSGASALIYELVGAKILEYSLGTTTLAITAVLTACFAGLSLGSFLFGRLINRWDTRGRVRSYAFIEIGIGLWAFISLLLLKLINQLPPPFALSFILSLIVFLVLFSLIGATWPLFNSLYLLAKFDLKKQLGQTYGFNTLGGVLAIMLVVFVLASRLGLTGSFYLAALLNILIGIFVFRVGPFIEKKIEPLKEQATPFKSSQIILYLFLLTGFAALSLEVIWTRLLVLGLGSTVYAFGIILLTFLLGIALGSVILGRLLVRVSSIYGLGLLLLGIFLWIFFTFPLIDNLGDFFVSLSSQNSFWGNIFSQFWLAVLIIFPATFMMGGIFPLGLALYSGGEIRALGDLYAFNTLGGIGGPVLTTFVFIPFFGLEKSFRIIAAFYLVLGFILLVIVFQTLFKRILTGTLYLALVIGFLFLPSWSKEVLSKGKFLYRQDSRLREGKLLFYKEGLQSTIAIQRKSGETYLSINGKADASDGIDLATELLLGHLPLLFSQDRAEVLVVGLGSGITAGAASLHPAKKIDIVEIEKAVAEGTSYFSSYNQKILENPKAEVKIDDARHYLNSSSKKYNVITSEPSNPWMAGESNLFTKEFFQTTKSHLETGGVMAQWVHLYNLGWQDLTMILKTFQTVYPNMEIWLIAPSDLILLGFEGNKIDEEEVKNRLQEQNLLADLKRLGIVDLKTLFDYQICQGENLSFPSPQFHTDNFPYLEYNAPRYLGQNTLPLNLRKLQELIEIDSDGYKNVFMEGLITVKEDNLQKAVDSFDKAISLRPKNPWTRQVAATAIYETTASQFLSQKKSPLPILEKGLSWQPTNIHLLEALGFYYLNNNELDKAHPLIDKAVSLYPDESKGYVLLGMLWLKKNDLAKAEEALLRAIEEDDQNFLALNDLAQIYLQKSDKEKARQYLKKSLKINPSQKDIKILLNKF